MGFSARGAKTDDVPVAAPSMESSGPKLECDSRYPQNVQNGFTQNMGNGCSSSGVGFNSGGGSGGTDWYVSSDGTITSVLPHQPYQSSAQNSAPVVTSNETFIYELNSKHGTVKIGDVSAAPKDGPAALDNSVQVKPTSLARIGVDKANNELVILRNHDREKDAYHGYVVKWGELDDEMKNALRRRGLVDKNGKIT